MTALTKQLQKGSHTAETFFNHGRRPCRSGQGRQHTTTVAGRRTYINCVAIILIYILGSARGEGPCSSQREKQVGRQRGQEYDGSELATQNWRIWG